MPSTSLWDGGFNSSSKNQMPPEFLIFIVVIWLFSLFGILLFALYYGL